MDLLRRTATPHHEEPQAERYGTWQLDLASGALTASRRCRDHFGHDEEGPFTFRTMREAIHPEDSGRLKAALDHTIATGAECAVICRTTRAGVPTNWLQVQAEVVRAEDGSALRLAGISLDITDRERTRERLARSHRVEAVGRLAAGVAHDFNNMLQALLGGIELALDEAAGKAEVRANLELALQAGRRGARLAGHLLSFSRQQTWRPAPLDLSPLLMELAHTLRRTLGRDIAVLVEVAPGLPAVLADAAQLDAALLNLAINARDAMPDGGTLRVEARAEDGQVLLTVTDTGGGMTPEVLAQACQPFFTTKGANGSGLGLAMVQDFARQHSGGRLHIASAPGQGTRIELRLPRAPHAATPDPLRTLHQLRGRGRVLLIDDEPEVSRVAAAFLRKAGFDVTTAGSGSEALAGMGEGRAFDVLVTDFAIPGLNGAELVWAARERQPGLPALVVTGYALAVGLDRLPADVMILRKPFERQDFVNKVISLIDDAPLAFMPAGYSGPAPDP